MKSYLGIDLGGSKIEYGVLKGGEFEFLGRVETPKKQEEILLMLSKIIAAFKGDRVGLGVAGLVDKKREKVLFSPNLPLNTFHLKAELLRLTNRTVVIENDVNCFVLAEYLYSKPEVKNLVGLTLGTGIGGGLILEGKLYRGEGMAGEAGHMVVLADGPECHCGGKGCLEALASGWALAGEGQKVAGREIKVEEMAEKARQGELPYIQIFKKMGYYLGIGVSNLVNLLSPEEVVIGGSLLKATDLFWGEFLSSLKNQSFPALPWSVKIRQAERLEGEVAFGAALAAKGEKNA